MCETLSNVHNITMKRKGVESIVLLDPQQNKINPSAKHWLQFKLHETASINYSKSTSGGVKFKNE